MNHSYQRGCIRKCGMVLKAPRPLGGEGLGRGEKQGYRPTLSIAPYQRHQRGAALLVFMILMVTATLAYLVNSLSPAEIELKRQRKTEEALVMARDALLGYALRYREDQIADGQPDRVYGYLPLPDLGTDRNNNASCTQEGCDAANFSGNALNTTVIGRLPWRTLGLPPLRDGYGECLWYSVSGSHQRQQRVSPMNWDTLGQLDEIVVQDGDLTALGLTGNDLPVAMILSPGASFISRSSSTAIVDECGGSYKVAESLETGDLSPTFSTAGNANGASGDTYSQPKPLSIKGKIPASTNFVANDTGLSITGNTLFGAIRKHSYFRTDINTMLDQMVICLRDQFLVPGKTFVADKINGYTPPSGKVAGRIPDDNIDNDNLANSVDPDFPTTGIATAANCYDDAINPIGYFSHYKDQIFVAKSTGADFTAITDGTSEACSGVLIFAGQRDTATPRCPSSTPTLVQIRSNENERNDLCNYLEGDNLSSFTGSGTAFSGARMLSRVSSSHTSHQDIVRCIPNTASFTSIRSTDLPGLPDLPDNKQLANYDPGTRTLTLGKLGVSTDDYPAASLFGCSWTSEPHETGSGFRSYFKFRITNRGEGFTFAIVDADQNTGNRCGAARQHLGYSGDNTDPNVEPITPPKMAVEFDTSIQATAFDPVRTNTLNNGRSDLDYADGHVALVYWGGENAYPVASSSCNAPRYKIAGQCYLPAGEDDNVHGLPPPTSPDIYSRPPPRNPPANAENYGVARLYRSSPTNRDFHVRVELTRIAPALAIPVRVAVVTSINLTTPGAMVDSVALAEGDRLLLLGQTPSSANGIYTWNGTEIAMSRASDADTSTKLENLTVAVSSGSLSGSLWRQTAQTPVVDQDPLTWLLLQQATPYRIEVWLLSEDNPNQRDALKNTTRPMSQLYPGYLPTLQDEPVIYDIAGSESCSVSADCPSDKACGAGSVCYSPAFRQIRLGFTNSQSTASKDQLITVSDFATTWIP